MDDQLTKTEIDMLLQLLQKAVLPVNQTLQYVAPIMRKLNNQLKAPEPETTEELTPEVISSNLTEVG